MPMPLAAWVVCNTFLRYLLEKVLIISMEGNF